MIRINHKSMTVTIAATVLLSLTACDRSENPAAGEDATASTGSAVVNTEHAWVLASAPGDAVSILDAKASAKEGDEIVLRGRIGGRASPIAGDSPVFTIVDLGLPYCGEVEEEGCKTPWDYCCETPETVTRHSATVQIVTDGVADPVAAGLEPLDELILIGTVGPRLNDDMLTIRATGVYPTGG